MFSDRHREAFQPGGDPRREGRQARGADGGARARSQPHASGNRAAAALGAGRHGPFGKDGRRGAGQAVRRRLGVASGATPAAFACASTTRHRATRLTSTWARIRPGLWPEDIDLLHRLWLDLSQRGLGPKLHHRDVVRVALRHLDAELRSPQADSVLGVLSQELNPQPQVSSDPPTNRERAVNFK